MLRLNRVVVLLCEAQRLCDAAKLRLFLVLEHLVGHRHLDEHLEHFEPELPVGKLAKVAGPIVIAEQRNVADLIGEEPTDRVDAILVEAEG